MKVCKYGGASLRSGEDLVHIARLVAAEPGPAVGVVSALQGVTDTILDGLVRVRAGEDAVPRLLEALRTRHTDVAKAIPSGEASAALDDLEPLFERLDRLLYGIAFTEELTPRTRDLSLAFGERLSARLLAHACRALGVDAEPLDADAAGIVTDGVFGAATPDLAATRTNLERTVRPRVDAGRRPILTGYFGRDADGHVTTFGRGGSDFSGAIVAAALGAEVLEVWKDVDGFLTADPRLCPQARPLPFMTYGEAAELAYLGAKVLHPRTVEPLEPQGIPVHVRSTKNPQHPGTRIGPPRAEAAHLRAIGARDGFAIVRLHGPGMAYTPGVGRDVFAVLGDAGVNVVNMAASQASFALLVESREAARARELVLGARIPTVEGVDIADGLTLVCFVGQGIGEKQGIAARVFDAVAQAGVNVQMISVGASNIALNFVIPDADKARAVNALHHAFLRDAPEASA